MFPILRIRAVRQHRKLSLVDFKEVANESYSFKKSDRSHKYNTYYPSVTSHIFLLFHLLPNNAGQFQMEPSDPDLGGTKHHIPKLLVFLQWLV